MNKFIYIAVFVSVLAAFSGCEKEEPEEKITMYEFFDEYLSVICDSAAGCKSGFVSGEDSLSCPDVILHYPFPFAGFKRDENVIFKQKYDMMINSATMGWIELDRKQTEECFELLREMAPCNPMEVHLLEIVECATVFEGTKSLRQDCGQDEECLYGWCNTSGGRCPGVCEGYKEPGQSCTSQDKCPPGYTCRTSGCSKSTVGEPGDPCNSDVDCSSFLYCRRKNEDDATGNCFKRKNDGEPCLDDNECLTGLDCINNLCSKARISDNVDAQCGTIEEEGEDVEYSCNVFKKLECGPQNKCQKFPQQGQPCAEICDKSLYCDEDSGLCQYQGAMGRPCDSDIQCASFYCFNGVCGAPECIDVH